MKHSKYNITLVDHPKDCYTTIYNLLTKEYGCYLSSLLSDFSESKIVESMKSKGFVIDEDCDEIKIVEKVFENEIGNKRKLSLMLLLTSRCNCNCSYCYEKDDNALFPYGFDIDNAVSFIDDYMKSNDETEKIEVVFYGGEPLLMKSVIDSLSCILHSKYGERFFFAIITNGTLLNAEDIFRWENWGLKVLKITIDGCRESHNRRRPYGNGRCTYDDILSNLETLKGNVEIRINTVLDNDVFGYDEMLDDLEKKGIKATYSINLTEPCCLTDENKVDLYIRSATELKKRNLFQYVKLSAAHGEICQAKRENDYVIEMEMAMCILVTQYLKL